MNNFNIRKIISSHFERLNTLDLLGILAMSAYSGSVAFAVEDQIPHYCLKPEPPIENPEFYMMVGLNPRAEYSKYFDDMNGYFVCLDETKRLSMAEIQATISSYEANFAEMEIANDN